MASSDLLEYDRKIIVTNQGESCRARLKVIRLPKSWYAVIWESSERYASFSQKESPRNGGFEHLDDVQFLDRVHLVAGFDQGIEFEFED